MTRYKLIVNPIAGRGVAESSIPRIDQLLRDHGLAFDIVRTQGPWHASDLAQEAVNDGYHVVVAVGGDGTANEVLNGLMRAKQTSDSESTLGVLSVGRGNDFAYGAGVPSDLTQACKVLAQSQPTRMDVGFVQGGLYPEGRYFGNGVGIGFDAVVGFEALKMKRLSGFISYLVAALKTIFLYYKAPKVLIECDDQTMEMYTLMVSTMNGRRMGGGFMMAPQALNDDGLFDYCIASQVSRARIFALIPLFMNGTQANNPAITTGQTRKISVTALEGVLPAHSDGETLCTDGKSLSIQILPGQLQILCLPERAPS